MSHIVDAILESGRENAFLSGIRNSFILLLIGIAVLEFGGRLMVVGPFFMLLVLFMMVTTLYIYWKNRKGYNDYDLFAYIMIGVIFLVIWILVGSFETTKVLAF